jgi:hypothetical protein
MSASKLLTMSVLFLVSNGSVALSPVPPPPVPPDVRLTIGIGINTNGLFHVYRALERVATQAKFTCHPTMKDYESWRTNGFEPKGRNMVCDDSHHNVVDGSWVNVAPESITIDVRITTKDEASKARIDRLVEEMEKSLKADRSVMTVVQENWSPEQTQSTIK